MNRSDKKNLLIISIIFIILIFFMFTKYYNGMDNSYFNKIDNINKFNQENLIISQMINESNKLDEIDTKQQDDKKEKTTKMLFSIVSLSVASLVFKVTSFFQKAVYIIINDEE